MGDIDCGDCDCGDCDCGKCDCGDCDCGDCDCGNCDCDCCDGCWKCRCCDGVCMGLSLANCCEDCDEECCDCCSGSCPCDCNLPCKDCPRCSCNCSSPCGTCDEACCCTTYLSWWLCCQCLRSPQKLYSSTNVHGDPTSGTNGHAGRADEGGFSDVVTTQPTAPEAPPMAPGNGSSFASDAITSQPVASEPPPSYDETLGMPQHENVTQAGPVSASESRV